MLFTEVRFLFFFALVFSVYWLLRRNGWRKVWLLLASYVFYAAWDWRFLSLIFTSTAVDYVVGLRLRREHPWGGRRFWLVVSLVCNLGLLSIFKYLNFFVESAVTFFEFLGLPASHTTLNIILPVGISFYTFQTLSYTIDVFRKKIEPTKNLLDFALFVGFFPQLVAGPIVRAIEFLPQLKEKRRIRDVAIRASLVLFLFGYVKKACVADHFASYVDPIYADPGAYNISSLWMGACLYVVQIYCDFSGYSDMAIATGGLLGYKLPLNFYFPYLVKSISEGWRRWHITLYSFMRDYLYISLGGSRVGGARILFNVLFTMSMVGFWHGASWNFMLFGLYHGLVLVLERVTGLSKLLSRTIGVGSLYAVAVWMISTPLFRTADLSSAVTMTKGLFGFGPPGENLLSADYFGMVLFLGFAVVHVAMYRRFLHAAFRSLPDWAFALLFGVCTAVALAFTEAGYTPFIYFQF